MEQPPYLVEDEIDLRQYVAVLLKYWVWIVAAGLIAALAALLFTSLQPASYQAQADVLLLETRTELRLDPNFQTTVGELDARSSLQTLVSLVKSNDVAVAVLEQEGELFGDDEALTPRDLLQRISTTTAGNLISIVATGSTPEEVADLANLWAATYIDYVNELYNTQKESLLLQVKAQAEDVQQQYQTVQGNLERLLADNRIETLTREVQIKRQQAEDLRNRAALMESASLYQFGLAQDSRRQLLADKYTDLQQVEGWLDHAAALQSQVAANPDRPENQVALLLLRSQMAGGESIQLQLNPADFQEQPVTPEDVAQLIAGLTAYRDQLQADIEQLAAAPPLEPDETTAVAPPAALTGLIAQLDSELQQLEGELEAQSARKRELTQARDLAWENLNTVQRKVSEVELSTQVTDTRVRSAGAAIPPEGPAGSGRLTTVAIAGLLGVLLAVFAVFAWEWWRSGAPATPERSE
ncbi:MAG: hypothetical protein Kow0031_33450 [Anaerolineae bacterium]